MKVLMLHSVGNELSNWYYNWLSVSINHFETFCKFLANNNYETCFLDDWYSVQMNSIKIRDKKIYLTFDDGYLDNWVYAYPILKKYNLKGTIFINPEFIDPSNEKRKTLFDVWNGNIKFKDLITLGFLNWSELIEMDKSDTIDIQSHSMSHNFYFSSNEIIDVYVGQEKYKWISWYLTPKLKPYYINKDLGEFIPYGMPIFKYGRALELRRYIPDNNFIENASEIYKSNYKKEINSEYLRGLKELIKKYPGRYETDEEVEKRYRYELVDSKNILQNKLNKNIEFLCWPGGGYNELAVKISKEAGYKASTLATRDRFNEVDNRNSYKRISRNGLGSFVISGRNKYLIRNKNYLVQTFNAMNGEFVPRVINKLRRIYYNHLARRENY